MAIVRCLRGNRLFRLELQGEDAVGDLRPLAHRVAAALGAPRAVRIRFAAAVFGLGAEALRLCGRAGLGLHLASGRRDGWLCARLTGPGTSRKGGLAGRLATRRPELLRLVDRFECGEGAAGARALIGVRLRHLRRLGPELIEELRQALSGLRATAAVAAELAALRRRLELPHLHDAATGLLRREQLEQLVMRRYERLRGSRGGFALAQLRVLPAPSSDAGTDPMEQDELLGDLADRLLDGLGDGADLGRAGPSSLLLFLPGADGASAPLHIRAALGDGAARLCDRLQLQVAVPRCGERAPLFVARSRRLFAAEEWDGTASMRPQGLEPPQQLPPAPRRELVVGTGHPAPQRLAV